MGTRRLFFALWPDSTTREAVVAETQGTVRTAGGVAISPADYHLTLAFLGNLPPDEVPLIRDAVVDVSVTPGTLILNHYGHFKRAQVFWLGATAVPPSLTRLVVDIWTRIAGTGISLGNHLRTTIQENGAPRWIPHLTLCRKVRPQPNVRVPEPVRWSYDHFVLAESVAGKDTRYQVLASFPRVTNQSAE